MNNLTTVNSPMPRQGRLPACRWGPPSGHVPRAARHARAIARNNPMHTIHSFPRELAQKHGWKAAIILKWLAIKTAMSQHVFDGKRWYYETIDSLAQRFPYIGRATIHDILARLARPGGPLLKGDYNQSPYIRTCWYAFTDDSVRRSVSTKPVYFSVKDATELGVVEAVLLMNLTHWIKKNREKDSDYTWHRMSGQGMTQHLPFTKSAINRALDHLFKAGELDRRPAGGFCRCYEYRVMDETRLKDASPDVHAASPDVHAARPDDHASGSDNKTLIDTDNRHSLRRHSYKERPASPSAGGRCVFSEVTESESSSSNGHTPCQFTASPATGEVSTNQITIAQSASAFQQLCDRNQSREELTRASRLCGLAYLTVKDVINSTNDEVLWQIIQIANKDELLKAVSPLLDNREDKSWAGEGREMHRNFVEDLAREFFVAACVECRNRTHNLPEPASELVKELNRKLRLRFEAAENERQQHLHDELWKHHQERADKHRSPDKAKEGDVTISAAEKVQVLRNSLIARNRAGWATKEGKLTSQVVEYNDRSLKAAYRFFQANPDVSVDHLNLILDRCVDVRFWRPVREGERDPSFWIRGGTNLSFFFGHLDKIITQADSGDQVPPINYLSKEEMGLDRKPAAPADIQGGVHATL